MLVVVSMTLSVVLLQLTYLFAQGFDMDKYLSKWVVSDFVVGDAAYFQTSINALEFDMPSVPQEDIDRIKQAGQITEDGRIYGHRGGIKVYEPVEAVKKEVCDVGNERR